MSQLYHELITHTAAHAASNPALQYRDRTLNYGELSDAVACVARGLQRCGIERHERVSVYLPKRFETVHAFYGTSMAGGVFVPVNPQLKAEQVGHILRDSNTRVLITSKDRAAALAETLEHCHDLRTLVLIDGSREDAPKLSSVDVVLWDEFIAGSDGPVSHRCIDMDMVAILYTSGSTGRPKGVVLSHRNLVTGAKSVSHYVENHPGDRLLAVLPFSFDYGLSQLNTAFSTGACTVLLDYLVPRDVITAVGKERITGLAAVPPLWIQLAQLPWSGDAVNTLRYITNSGGAMPRATVDALRKALPKTRVYLMYGLTEAFRSTYLPPEELDRRPDSIGKAIPNAEIVVVREDGTPCAPGEPGELVHRGSLVALGYWNDPEKTAERFKPAPGRESKIPLQEIAVWSGDTVRTDEEGFLYFVGRKDDMIKTSGYRVSPTEVEEVLYGSGLVGHAAALGIPHPVLGQAIVAVVSPAEGRDNVAIQSLLDECKTKLPAFMVPAQVHVQRVLPRNPNGKIDRKQLTNELRDLFANAK
jgi:acyl-CoA ligase (AMP-forming) (exosortase A-associated)